MESGEGKIELFFHLRVADDFESGVCPEPFQLVKVSRFLLENVNHYMDKIHEHPP